MKKQVVWRETPMVNVYTSEVEEVVQAIGVKRAWVGDDALVGDFVRPDGTEIADLAQMKQTLGFVVAYTDRVWEVAKRLFDSRNGK